MVKITKGLENKIHREIEKWEKDEVLTFKEMWNTSPLYATVCFDYRGQTYKCRADGKVYWVWGDESECIGTINL